MSSRYWITAKMDVYAGKEEEFHRFEAKAQAIMAKYGGRVESVERNDVNENYQEIHHLSFPSEMDFNKYLQSKESSQLQNERSRIILRTHVTPFISKK